jgi:hypothetical protein
MKNLFQSLFALALVFEFSSCSAPGGNLPPISSIPPGVASEGTLANHVLAQDASLAIRKLAGGNKRVTKFVVQKPVGKPGRKAWRELWIFDLEGKPQRFMMTFRENGEGSADYEIKKL